ncbi:MAG: TetR family transcriptional regulator [Deltaproteobacteria bacterium]|nr:TetR family transcriptional regulator [Deltaproteobacteria bacterium]
MGHPGQSLPAEERRALTVEAVIALAAEKNPAEITTAAIAHRMGLTQGALFRHFPNKDSLLQTVMQWVAERLLARIEQAVALASSPLAALESLFMARVEPLADAVTEELLAKVVFDEIPDPLPPLGELTEVTVALPALPEGPVIPNAALKRIDGRRGVWRVADGALRFSEIVSGAADLNGWVRVDKELAVGDQIVLYSAEALNARSRIKVVEKLAGVSP